MAAVPALAEGVEVWTPGKLGDRLQALDVQVGAQGTVALARQLALDGHLARPVEPAPDAAHDGLVGDDRHQQPPPRPIGPDHLARLSDLREQEFAERAPWGNPPRSAAEQEG